MPVRFWSLKSSSWTKSCIFLVFLHKYTEMYHFNSAVQPTSLQLNTYLDIQRLQKASDWLVSAGKLHADSMTAPLNFHSSSVSLWQSVLWVKGTEWKSSLFVFSPLHHLVTAPWEWDCFLPTEPIYFSRLCINYNGLITEPYLDAVACSVYQRFKKTKKNPTSCIYSASIPH